MTTQDYIDEELELDARRPNFPNPQEAQSQANGNFHPSEVILLRAKVRELTDQLAALRGRCADIARETKDDWKAFPEGSICDEIAEKIMEGE